ncbi:hypothetical protein G3M53_02145, partial [Streptomyces sp. SID7982]|nr:hypothetical protein [Streptomyces sp. SID7982]
MRIGRRRQATAVAAAVIGGLLGSVSVAPSAVAAPAAPSDPGRPVADTADRADATRTPSVWPRPQSMRTTGPAVPLGSEATLVAAPDADPYAVEQARSLL